MALGQGLQRSAAFRSNADLDLDAFRALCEQEVDPALVPSASAIVQRVPVFDAAVLRAATTTPEARRAMMAELNDCLLIGPGVFAVEGMMDPQVVDRASDVYWRIIEAERAAGLYTGDHFAKPGTNDRIWNSFQKLAEEASGRLRRLLRQRRVRHGVRVVAGPGLPDDGAGERRAPGWRRATAPP